MKYFLITISLLAVGIWFFNEYLGWGAMGSYIGACVACGIVIGYLDDRVKDLKKQVEELSSRQ